MKTRFGRIATAFGLFLMMSLSVWADPPSQVGRVNFLQGSVSFRPGTVEDWSPASLNYPLSEGDQLWTDQDGRVEIHIGSTALRLGADSNATFLRFDDQNLTVSLSAGSLNLRVRRLDPGVAIEVDTPNAVIVIGAVGSYRFEVPQDGSATAVLVHQGQARVTTDSGTLNIIDGQLGTISGEHASDFNVRQALAPDAFDVWSADRDMREDNLASARYAPREMNGIEDLDQYGSWTQVADYGSVWQPTSVPDGWAPYQFGRWAWVDPWGWTWIDAAPWGFAPFHYGRWAYVSHRWGWVPGPVVERPVYAPALVVFVGDAGTSSAGVGIGWFPLAPREVYIPPYSVSDRYLQVVNNTSRVTINIQVVQNINVEREHYANRDVPHALAQMPRQDFVQSRPIDNRDRVGPAPNWAQAHVVGMTAPVAPTRDSVVARPSGANVPRPPDTVDRRTVFSTKAPPPVPVPFTARQKELDAHPGRPVANDQLTRLLPKGPPTRAPVKLLPVPNKNQAQGQNPQQRPQPLPNQPQTPPGVPQRPQAPAPPVKPVPQKQPEKKPTIDQNAKQFIDSVKSRALPSAQQKVAAAKRVPGTKVDFRDADQKIASAQSLLARADGDLAAGRNAQAMQEAQDAQSLLNGINIPAPQPQGRPQDQPQRPQQPQSQDQQPQRGRP